MQYADNDMVANMHSISSALISGVNKAGYAGHVCLLTRHPLSVGIKLKHVVRHCDYAASFGIFEQSGIDRAVCI